MAEKTKEKKETTTPTARKRGRQKGCVKTGGRKKGTPNKATSLSKSVISQLLSDYNESGLMLKDFKLLDPKERMIIAEKLLQYTIPKMQSTAVDLAVDEGKKSIVDVLTDLSKDE